MSAITTVSPLTDIINRWFPNGVILACASKQSPCFARNFKFQETRYKKISKIQFSNIQCLFLVGWLLELPAKQGWGTW
ncbi:hypothetical protein A2767_00615 [Candidatus Roizmanbacteria bacterium RIFCSPHIGHO2_01_FULL_35_10]|uniref:Uncharacterized protein n=1 Tax=Candidatus Roizmanbacteria bacterium RIFCSPLOWO2_01_FULL_35_13 TaxID=1802055 RepID=A0A1F7IHJ3_9BACT|nr:MAG: hypothetical protein A2767_00615 [Candidatus Roizmanbacteria bacterium RIFCSPHIGHO2_01_FULL_35_10]OGK42840.1 MAG: hypothetical protein A3A74_01380 [Candidatus Roizmanbacteria bacterium RIFCSPLOWO2_01_FULL_35_13]